MVLTYIHQQNCEEDIPFDLQQWQFTVRYSIEAVDYVYDLAEMAVRLVVAQLNRNSCFYSCVCVCVFWTRGGLTNRWLTGWLMNYCDHVHSSYVCMCFSAKRPIVNLNQFDIRVGNRK